MESFISLDIHPKIEKKRRRELMDTIMELSGIEYVDIDLQKNRIRVEGSDIDPVEITDRLENIGFAVLR